MYSPKIKEDLIPKIYQAARSRRIKMTTLVNRILENALNGGGEVESSKAVQNGEEVIFSKEDGGNPG